MSLPYPLVFDLQEYSMSLCLGNCFFFSVKQVPTWTRHAALFQACKIIYNSSWKISIALCMHRCGLMQLEFIFTACSI